MQEFWVTAYVHQQEILEFIQFLGHGAIIRTLTNVNINKLYQSWRSFAAIINKCLTGKSSGYDSFRLSQAQILWGLYHTRSIDYAFLIWEDFMYQVENKNQKKTPKPKASARRKRSGSDTYITPPTATTTPTTTVVVTPKLTAAVKGKQPAKAKCLSDPSEVARTEAQQLKIVLRKSRQQTHISQPGGSGIDEGTGADDQEKVGDDDEGDEGNDSEEGEEDDDDEDKNGNERDDDDQDQEIAKHDDKDDTEESGDVDKEVKAQVTRILPRIEEAMNAQLEDEVLTRSSHSSRTSYVVAADLSKWS
nr:hypothetical protein [Tanacetum cinerariifolium]